METDRRNAAAPARPAAGSIESATSGLRYRTRLRNSSTVFSMGVPDMNSTRSAASDQAAVRSERCAAGFFT